MNLKINNIVEMYTCHNINSFTTRYYKCEKQIIVSHTCRDVV